MLCYAIVNVFKDIEKYILGNKTIDLSVCLKHAFEMFNSNIVLIKRLLNKGIENNESFIYKSVTIKYIATRI